MAHIQIPDVPPRVQYTADGVETIFAYPFPIFEDDDLRAYLGDVLQTTGYTVAGAGVTSGGTVTFDSAPADQTLVTFARNVVTERTTDFQTSGTFRANVVNDEFDAIFAILQQVEDEQDRSITVAESSEDGPVLELPGVSDRANKHLAFDGTGAVSLTSDAPVSDLKYTDPPITLANGAVDYSLPSEVQSGLDEDNYAGWVVGGDRLIPGTDFTVTGDTLTMLTVPTVANGMAGQLLMVELVRPAINATAVQPGTVGTNAIADGAVTSDKLSFSGQADGDLLKRGSADWEVFPAETTDGKYLLQQTISGSGTANAFAWKQASLLNDWSFPALNSTPTTIINTITDDDVKMTITEGDEILTRSITIDSDTAGVAIWVDVHASCAVGQTLRIGLFRNGATDALREVRHRAGQAGQGALPALTHSFMYLAAGITTGAVTYSVRIGCTDATGRVNEEFYSIFGGPGRKGGGNVGSSMFILELGSKT